MGKAFYGVAHGFKRGVFTDWNEAKSQIDGFPQPVYKKFDEEKKAEEYVKERKPKKIELAYPEGEHETYYTVARGNVVGVFTDYDDVKKNINEYPQPLYKKFAKLDEAIAYFKKYYEGKDDGNIEKSNGKEKTKKKEEKKEKKEKTEKPVAYYAVARGHKTGVFTSWDECKKQTTDFKGAKFKKFDNEEDAKLFAEGKTLKQIEEAHNGGKKRKSDGHSSSETGEDEEEKVEKKKKKK